MNRSRRSLTNFLIALLMLGASPYAAHAQLRSVSSDQETLVKLEQEWNEAFYHKDMAFLGRVLADEFIATYEDGTRGDRTKELALTEAFDQQVDSSVPNEFTVKVYGDSAVVWFTLNLVGPKQGRLTAVSLKYVDVFVWRDGRWQCVSSQSTKVLAP